MRYTASEATREVMREMHEGERVKGYELYERVLGKLKFNGVNERPLDSTVLRRVRQFGPDCRVFSVGMSKSEYVKV
ncbi:MAG: hypothetical protein ACQGQO_04720 [Sphaerochaetaceae bacterium]